MGHRTASAKGAFIRAHRRDSGKTTQEIEDLRRALIEAKTADYLERLLDEPPGLTIDQRNRLVEMLQGAS